MGGFCGLYYRLEFFKVLLRLVQKWHKKNPTLGWIIIRREFPSGYATSASVLKVLSKLFLLSAPLRKASGEWRLKKPTQTVRCLATRSSRITDLKRRVKQCKHVVDFSKVLDLRSSNQTTDSLSSSNSGAYNHSCKMYFNRFHIVIF